MKTGTNQTLNPKHEIFINEMMKHGNKIRAYKAAYGEEVKDESARVSASNLLKDDYISERLEDSWKSIRLGIQDDKAAFIHQELKIIAIQRKALLEIIGDPNNPRPTDIIRAIRLDNELAEKEAGLRNYGSLKPAKAKPADIREHSEIDTTPVAETEPVKNEDSVIKRNIPAENPLIIPVKKVPGSYKPSAICADNKLGEEKNRETVINRNIPNDAGAKKEVLLNNRTLNLHSDIANI